MDRPWEAFDCARRVLRGRDDLVGWKSADLPSVLECTFGAGDVTFNRFSIDRHVYAPRLTSRTALPRRLGASVASSEAPPSASASPSLYFTACLETLDAGPPSRPPRRAPVLRVEADAALLAHGHQLRLLVVVLVHDQLLHARGGAMSIGRGRGEWRGGRLAPSGSGRPPP